MSDDNPQTSPINHGRPLPPAEHQFKPGQSGNPKGRAKNAGSTLREWLNALADKTEDEWRTIERDKSQPGVKRAAAKRWLRTVETPDPADFEDFQVGKETLADLKARGIDTTVIKKNRRHVTKTTIVGGQHDGLAIESEFTCEIELHDRSGDDFDRIFDRTEGRPGVAQKEDDSENALKTIRVRRITQTPQPPEPPPQSDDARPG